MSTNYFDDNRDHDEDDGYPFGNNFHRGSDHSDFNKRILFTAIASLSLVLVLVFALHLYARFILRRQARRRAAIHQLSLTVAQAQSIAEPPNTGLDPTLIATLPTFPFKPIKEQQQQQEEENHECAVCLSVLEYEETVRLLPNCKHTFHVGCIDTWLASHSTCPVCRTKVEPPRPEPQPREGPTGLGLHGAPPSAPLLLIEPPSDQGTSDAANASSPKMVNSRLSSFRRILSRERSSRRIQPSSCDDIIDHDLERQ